MNINAQKVNEKKFFTFLGAFVLLAILFLNVYSLKNPKESRLSLGAVQGDINGDNRVDILDFQILSNSFGKSQGQAGYNQGADINADTRVDILDFQILSNNFGRAGITPTSSLPSITQQPLPTISLPPIGNPRFVVSQSSGCSDSGPGTINQPFCTIPRAISAAQPGDTIAVRGGTYSPFSVSKSGTSGNYITIAAYNNERPRVNGGSEGIGIVGKSYIRIVGFEVTGATGGYGGGGIYLGNGANNNIIESNITHSNLAGFTSGINVNASSNNKIINNTSYNNGLKGIRVAQGGNNQIIGNRAYSNRGNGGGSDGITTTEGSVNNLIKDNIVYNNSDDGIDCWSSHGNTIIGNVSYENLGPGDGNGLKLGGTESGGQHLVIGNVSYNNKRDGFDSNHSYGNTYYNNVAVGNNGVGFRDTDKFANCIYSNCRTIYINNIGYNNGKNLAASQHTGVSHNNIWFSTTGGSNVAYQGGGNTTTYSSLSAFFSATGNRLDNPNNGNLASYSLNPLFVNVGGANFNLSANSPAIDKGDPSNPGNIRAVGIPDIGAFEYNQ